MKKRALSLLLVFAMILSFVPTTALAAGNTENNEETPGTRLQEQINKGGTVALTENIELSDTGLEIKNNVVLDLAGFTITRTTTEESGYSPAISICGEENATTGIRVTIKNGSVVATGAYGQPCGIDIKDSVSKVTLNGVNITASKQISETKGHQAWGLVITHKKSDTIATNVTLDAACSVTGCGGIAIMDAGDGKDANSAASHLVVLNVDGNVTSTRATGDYAAISGNGLDRSYPQITIGGKVDATGSAGLSTEAIYLPEKCETLIKSGATVTGKTGIAMKSGSLEIEDGATIHATGEYAQTPTPRTNGIDSDGSAIFLESYHPAYQGDMYVTIGSGATLRSDKSYAIRENNQTDSTEQLKSLIIEDGANLIATSKTEAVDTPILLFNGESAKVTEIQGGNYSHPVEYKYLAKGEDTAAEGALIWEAKADSGEAPYTYHANLEDALKVATSITKRVKDPSTLCVTMKYNDGTEGGTKYDVNYYEVKNGKFKIPEDATPTAAGKNFAGWERNDTDKTKYNPGDPVEKIDKDVILTATWTETGATVKFDFTAVSGVTLDLEPKEEENWIPNLTGPADDTDEGKNTYTIADKTKDVTFKLNDQRTNPTTDIAVSYQVGSSTEHELSCDANKVYTLPSSEFSSKTSVVNIKVSEVSKKTVTFNFGTLTTLDVDSSGLENLTKDTQATDAKKYTVGDKTKVAKFKLTGGDGTQKFTVTYKVGETGTEEVLEPDASGVYTLPANLADNVTVTVTAADKNTITFTPVDEIVGAYVESIGPAKTGSNLKAKDETATPKVYVAEDDTLPISFVVTEKTDATDKLPDNHHIVVKYKLAKDADSAYKTVSGTDNTYTLAAKDITGDIIVTAFVEATPVYEATPSISGSTTTTTITETEVIANIEAAKDQKEPLTIEAKVGTESVTKSEVELAGNLIQTITSTETKVDLAVTTDVGKVELPSETVSEIVDKNSLTENDPLTVKVEDKKDQIDTITNVVANAISLFDVTLMSGSKEVNAEDLGLKLRITLTFKIETGLINPKLYRFENGKGIELSDVSYNPETGEISGKTDHLSEFYAAVAADAKIISVLGQGVKTNGTGGIGEPEVFNVPVPNTNTVITANDIKPSDDKNATVTLYSDSAFTAEESSITLKDGANVVYAKVTNATDTNGSTAYYKITVNKANADCTLSTVLEQSVKTTDGAGTKEEPYVVTVASNASELQGSDIKANSTSATVTFYGTDNKFTTAKTDKLTLSFDDGKASAYATVTNGGTTVYYEINVTGVAIDELKVTLSTDGTKVNVDPETAATGSTRKYAIVADNPEAKIASWNKATAESSALGAEISFTTLNNTFTFKEADNGKYIVVADVKDSKIVAAGSMKIQLPVTVTIDGTGLATGDTLTVARGTASVATGDKVPYGTSLKLTLSNANYVVYAGDDVVPMDGFNGTYTVTGNTTFSVEPGYSVEIKDDSNAIVSVTYDVTGTNEVHLYKGVSMVPKETNGDPTNLNIELKDKYILMVNGAKVELDEDDNTASVPVKADTTIEVVPGYNVTVNTNNRTGFTLQIKDGNDTLFDGTTSGSTPILVAEGTVLTIRFADVSENNKVQIYDKDVTFDINNTAVHTVTADVTIAVVSSTQSSAIDTLTVAVDSTGNPSVKKGDVEVTEGVIYAVISEHEDFTNWKNDKTQAEALAELKTTAITDLPLTTADNNKHLVALQIDEAGKVIAAGCSDPIKVSSPTTTTGYTVSGTVEKGNTNLETVAGILVTLKGANETKTTTVKADGTYEFVGVEAGTYDLEIALNAASKYDAVNQKVTVGTENVTVPTITLALVDPSTATALWGKLEVASEVIGESARATFTVTNMKAGMYYCITIAADDSIPSDQFFQADKGFWSFVTDKDSTISVIEFVDEVKFAADGNVDPTNPATRTKTYTAE